MTVSLADLTPVQLASMPAHRDCTLGTVLPNVTHASKIANLQGKALHV